MNPTDLEKIITAIKCGHCLAFLGAGVSTAFKNNKNEDIPGLPTGSELAEFLAKESHYSNGSIYDLQKVADYFLYKNSGNRILLESKIKEKIDIWCPPRPIHTVLAQLTSLKYIITSNYDTILEHELKKYNRKINLNIYDRTNSRAGHFDPPLEFEKEHILVHKMHGHIDIPSSMVITRSDYIRYLTNLNDMDRGMPYYFRKILIPQCSLLFLGYSLEDMNFQVIWDGILSLESTRFRQIKSYAIMKNVEDFKIDFWANQNVVIIDEDLTKFAEQLAEHFNLEIPQLGIAKKPEGGTHE